MRLAQGADPVGGVAADDDGGEEQLHEGSEGGDVLEVLRELVEEEAERARGDVEAGHEAGEEGVEDRDDVEEEGEDPRALAVETWNGGPKGRSTVGKGAGDEGRSGRSKSKTCRVTGSLHSIHSVRYGQAQ